MGLPTFHDVLKSVLDLPGVSQTDVAGWAGVVPSTVHRWLGGAVPEHPTEVLRRIETRADEVRRKNAIAGAGAFATWAPVLPDCEDWFRHHVQVSGIVATIYYAILSYMPSSYDSSLGMYNIAVARYFDEVFAQVTKGTYQIGDIAQTVSSEPALPEFVSESAFGSLFTPRLERPSQSGRGVFRVRYQLSFPPDVPRVGIRGIGSFGYRYIATYALRRHAFEGTPAITSEFLGAPTPIACKNLSLLVCLPRSGVKGTPCAVSYSNRAMIQYLATFGEEKPEEREALLWPLGQICNVGAGPESPLRRLDRPTEELERLPLLLQQQVCDWRPGSEGVPSLREIIGSDESEVFLLELRYPHPVLTHTVVYQLPRPQGTL